MHMAITNPPHAAVLASPGLGHLIPLLELAKRLVTFHDMHVTFLVITTHASAVQSQLLRSSSLPDGLRLHLLPSVDASSLFPRDTTLVVRISTIVRASLPSIRSTIADQPRPSVLIGDIFCTDLFEMAKELSVPMYVFFTASAKLLAFMLHLPTLDEEVEGEYVNLPGPVAIPGCDPIRTADLIDQVRNRKIDEYKCFLHHASRMCMAKGILVNTSDDIEPKTLAALRVDPDFDKLRPTPLPPVYPVGPLIKSDDGDQAEVMTWLDDQPADSVLYISFGSGGTLSAEQVTELARGLELSQQRFIWVVRPPSSESKAAASGTFFNVGSEHEEPSDFLPDGFLERIKGVGMVVSSWVPQVKVLRHASTGGFLTHCGWNSILESVVHGVPMIAWPLYAEQRMNATMLVESLGVAARPLSPPGRVVGREEIERVVRMVMEAEEGAQMRCRVEELKQRLSKAIEEKRTSYNLFCEVEKWKMGSKSSLGVKGHSQ